MLEQFRTADEQDYIGMAAVFYQGEAVAYPMSNEVLLHNFATILNSEIVDGYILREAQQTVGYCIVSMMYSTEIGGLCAWIEEVYIKPEFQGKGYGSACIKAILDTYKGKVKRFKLEITPANKGALALYERLGFSLTPYQAMDLNCL